MSAFGVLALLTALPWLNAVTPALVIDDASFPPEPAATLDVATLARYFREDAWAAGRVTTGAYRPLSLSVTRLESLLWGVDPRGYHATCVATHLAVTLALFALLASVLRAAARVDDDDRRPDIAAWLSALAFGVHPIHTEAVDSIFNRSEVMASLFVTLALLLIVRGAKRHTAALWTGVSALYFAGLLSKESAVTLPGLAALLLVLVRRPMNARDALRVVAPTAVLALPLGLYLALRTHALAHLDLNASEAHGLSAGAHWRDRIELTLTALREFWRMLVWPLPLRASYDDFTARGLASAVALHAMIVAACVALRKKAPAVGVGAAMVYLALLPVTRLVSHLGVVVTVAERYVYLPSIGFAVLFAGALFAASRRAVEVTVVVGALAYAALAPMTWLRNDDWRSDLALWESEVAVAPENPDGLKWLTAAYMNANRWDDVVRVCDDEARNGARRPPHAPLLVHCALAYENRRRAADAERALVTAASLDGSPAILQAYARFQVRARRVEEARSTYARAIEAERDPVRRDTLVGEMLLRTWDGRAAEAEAAYARALAVEPRFEAARVGLDRARRARGAP